MALESIHFSPVPPTVLATLSPVPTSKVFQAPGLNLLQVNAKVWNLILPLLYLPLMMVSPHLSTPWARLIRPPSSSSFSSQSPATSQVPRWALLNNHRTHTFSHPWLLHSWSLTYKCFPASPATLASLTSLSPGSSPATKFPNLGQDPPLNSQSRLHFPFLCPWHSVLLWPIYCLFSLLDLKLHEDRGMLSCSGLQRRP